MNNALYLGLTSPRCASSPPSCRDVVKLRAFRTAVIAGVLRIEKVAFAASRIVMASVRTDHTLAARSEPSTPFASHSPFSARLLRRATVFYRNKATLHLATG